MTNREDLQRRIDALEAELDLHRAKERLNKEADEALEVAMRDRLALARTLELLLPLVCEHTGAVAAFVHTFDEDLQPRDFIWPGEGGLGVDLGPVRERTARREAYVDRDERGCVIAQPLDVAGDLFGGAALSFDRALDELAERRARELLGVWCEELDNYLAAIARARRKSQVIRELSEALKQPVLDRGILRGIEVLARHVPFEDMLLIYRHEDETEGTTLNYKIVKERRLVHDSRVRADQEVDEFMRSHAFQLLSGGEEVPERFGIRRYREEVLINGIKEEQLVGRLVVTSEKGEFNTFDRDLLERFADHLRQRIVDFNKEWKYLSLCFPRETVVQLLSEEDYTHRYLRPREREVAVMYCDISGFTRVSEQLLKEPALIGKLIDSWSARVVEILWESGGVFDKMVGDCVIGLWGPPLFEVEPAEACAAAVDAARRIRDFTREMGAAEGLPQLQDIDPPLGVATGLNYCPLYVGSFGPNEDYTGFSSGMNNTARLQGVASRDEILCMDGFVAVHGGGSEIFGERRTASVKNVAEPLVFHPLK